MDFESLVNKYFGQVEEVVFSNYTESGAPNYSEFNNGDYSESIYLESTYPDYGNTYSDDANE